MITENGNGSDTARLEIRDQRRDPFIRLGKAEFAMFGATANADLPKDQQLTPTDLAVYLSILQHVNARTGSDAWPSLQTIADDVSVSRRSAIRSVARLEERGLIHAEKRRSGSRNMPSLYSVLDAPDPVRTGDTGSPSTPRHSANLSLPKCKPVTTQVPHGHPNKNHPTRKTEQDHGDESPVQVIDDRPAVNARWAAYWQAFADAKRLTPAQVRSQRSRAFGDLKRILPDHAAMDELPVERFAEAARRYAATCRNPEWVTIPRIIDAMAETATADQPDVEPLVEAFVYRREYGGWKTPAPMQDEARDSFARIVRQVPDLKPEHVLWAMTREWRRTGQPPTGKTVFWAVKGWADAGRPEVRVGAAH